MKYDRGPGTEDRKIVNSRSSVFGLRSQEVENEL